MPLFNVTADKVTSEGFCLKWSKLSGASSYLVTLEDEGRGPREVCFVLSGMETEHSVHYPIMAGQRYTATVRAYVETAIGQPEASYGVVSPIGYRLLQQKSVIIPTGMYWFTYTMHYNSHIHAV